MGLSALCIRSRLRNRRSQLASPLRSLAPSSQARTTSRPETSPKRWSAISPRIEAKNALSPIRVRTPSIMAAPLWYTVST